MLYLKSDFLPVCIVCCLLSVYVIVVSIKTYYLQIITCNYKTLIFLKNFQKQNNKLNNLNFKKSPKDVNLKKKNQQVIFLQFRYCFHFPIGLELTRTDGNQCGQLLFKYVLEITNNNNNKRNEKSALPKKHIA